MKSKQLVEIELLEDMYEYTVSINGVKRAISKSSYNTLKDIMENYPINQPQHTSKEMEELLEILANTIVELNSMYEENMECLGYHLNGDTEPLNNFLDNISVDGLYKVREYIQSLQTPTKEQLRGETRFVRLKNEFNPHYVFCEKDIKDGKIVQLSGWEEYCPICGAKITNKQENPKPYFMMEGE